MTYRVQCRGVSGCIVLEVWTDEPGTFATLEEAVAAARELAGRLAFAMRVVGPDGEATPIARQRATYVGRSSELYVPDEADEK